MNRYIVTGSRDVNQPELITSILDSYLTKHQPEQVLLITGGCRGVDTVARNHAITLNIPVKDYLPDWSTYGKSAGPIRNRTMLEENPDAVVIAFPSSRSKGTVDCVKQAKKMDMTVYVHPIE